MSKILHTLMTATAATAAFITPLGADAMKPAIPKALYSWGLEDNAGIVNCSMTAPANYYGSLFFDGDPIEADRTLTVTVVRSCQQLGEEGIEVFSVGGLSPGQTFNRVDNATPAWQYGYEYKYTAYAILEGEEEDAKSVETSSSIKPGYSFSSFYIDSATAAEDMSTVTITSTVPTTYKNASGATANLPADYFTSLKLYCQETSPTPADTPIETIDNPVLGQEYKFVTSSFRLNTENTFYVMAQGPLGNAVSVRRKLYIGYDTPGRVAITGVQDNRVVRLRWSEPTSGNNGRPMGPYPVRYNIYRTWGYGDDNRQLIASEIEGLEYTDNGDDLEAAKMLNYQVVPVNEVGEGNTLSFANGTNYAAMPFAIGPDASLPFVEPFLGGGLAKLDPQQLWLLGGTRPDWTFGRPAKTGTGYYDPTVQPLPDYKNEYIAYVLFDTRQTAKEATMTSWHINIRDSFKPVMKFLYYAINGTDGRLEVQVSDGVSEFVTVKAIDVSEGTNAADYDISDLEANWRPVEIDLSPYQPFDGFRVRLKASYTSKPGSVMVNHLEVRQMETSSAGAPAASADGEADIYTLTGILVARGIRPDRVNELPAGIYIARSQSGTRKISVR